jgi:hypothetical protein
MAAENPPSKIRYDLPMEFKVQVLHIWAKSIGFINSDERGTLRYSVSGAELTADQIYRTYERMNQLLCEEHGKIGLPGVQRRPSTLSKSRSGWPSSYSGTKISCCS